MNNIEISDKKTALSAKFCCFTLTDECMLRCRMCKKWEGDIAIKPENRQMGLSDWKKCALELKEFASPGFTINFGGGEVTTVSWLFDIVRFCHDLGFSTNIATNAFLIDRQMAQKIADSGLDYINISLDSIDESVHDCLRGGKGVYKNVMNAIDLIKQYSPRTKISICSVLMKPTIAGMPELIDWVQKNEKTDMIYLMVLMQPNNTVTEKQWWKNENWQELWPADQKQIEQVLDRIIERKQKGYSICNPVEHLEAFKAYFRDPDRFVKKNACHIDQAVHVSSVGDVFMCYEHERLGNLHDTGLGRLLNSEFAVSLRQKIKKCEKNCHFLLNCNFEE